MKNCPWCGSSKIDAEFVDIGVGMQQVSPYVCGNCCAVQIGPYDTQEVTEEEKKRGWYEGCSERPRPLTTTFFFPAPGISRWKMGSYLFARGFGKYIYTSRGLQIWSPQTIEEVHTRQENRLIREVSITRR